jgi:hypothetical protein
VVDPVMISADGRELGTRFCSLFLYLYPPGFVSGTSTFVVTHLADTRILEREFKINRLNNLKIFLIVSICPLILMLPNVVYYCYCHVVVVCN